MNKEVYVICIYSITTTKEDESKGLSTIAVYNCLNYEIANCASNLVTIYVYAQAEGTKIIFEKKFVFRNVTDNNELRDIINYSLYLQSPKYLEEYTYNSLLFCPCKYIYLIQK